MKQNTQEESKSVFVTEQKTSFAEKDYCKGHDSRVFDLYVH